MMPTAKYPDLDGVSVLITGGGTGIGAALTEGFIAQGAKVAFIDIAADESTTLCDRLERECGARPLFLEADLRDVAELRTAAERAANAHGDVLVLVNNAARDDRHSIEDVSEDFWDRNQALNLRPHFFTAQAVAPGMKRAGRGSIVNFTSTSFMINKGGMPSYTAAKGGIVGLTKGLAGELGPHGIRVNAIAPGWVMTERQRKLWITDKDLNAHIDRQCLKQAIEVGDIVGPCLFLASDAARMMSAQTMIVDAGYL